MASVIEAVGVVIPARNQADTIAQCILSIFAANSYAGWRNSLWIVVVADACRDKTVKVARGAVGAFGEVLEVAVQSSATARGIGAGTVLEHFHHKPRHSILLADTDADACVSSDWIDMQLKRQNASVGSIAHSTYIAAETVAFSRRFARPAANVA
ncbi:MAG TPA: glycosyltransferase [Steroidobacteraceae bacterium]|nr:glycosyltransferase [Steroidobacteraceae bacterium]